MKDFIKKYQSILVPVAILVVALSYVGYNKFLDWQEREDLKVLLSQMSKIEESSPGLGFSIFASCDSIGGEKFSNSYSCILLLESASKKWTSNHTHTVLSSEELSSREGCWLKSSRSTGFAEGEDSYNCSLSIRPSNEDFAEELFFDYDTTPGRK